MPPAKDLDRLLGITEFLLDEHVGIVQSLRETPKEAGTPDFFHFYAKACNTRAFSAQDNFSNTGGASADRKVAMAKAIGEAVERYCSAIYDIEELPLESFESAAFRCVHPGEFALHSRGQYSHKDFPWVPFKTTSKVRWTPATDPISGTNCHVPACMVYVPYFYRNESHGEPVAQSISTGLACQCSYVESAIAGICEVIERDSFTICWQGMISPPHIMAETLSDENFELVQRFERTGAKVTLLDITNDLAVPTILSILSSYEKKSPALVFAASSSLDPEEAARKSLEELAHTRRYSRLIKAYNEPVLNESPFHHIIDQTGHLGFWANHDNLSCGDFIFASNKRIDFSEIADQSTDCLKENLELLCNKISRVGLRVLVADLTTPDVEQLGLKVVHALVPGAHPLYMGHRNRALGGNRLWEVPQKLGFSGITSASGDNKFPHPYP